MEGKQACRGEKMKYPEVKLRYLMVRHTGFKAVLAWCVIVILTACKSERPKTEKPPPPQQNPAVVKLASKHGAVTDWRKTLKGLTFSVDVEHALIQNPGDKPILVVESLQDVFRRDGELWIRLASIFSFPPPAIDFELRCPLKKLGPIFENREQIERFGQFAVVAKVKSVRKIVLEINAIPINDEEAELELEPPFPFSERFLASGECVDLAYVAKKTEKQVP